MSVFLGSLNRLPYYRLKTACNCCLRLWKPLQRVLKSRQPAVPALRPGNDLRGNGLYWQFYVLTHLSTMTVVKDFVNCICFVFMCVSAHRLWRMRYCRLVYLGTKPPPLQRLIAWNTECNSTSGIRFLLQALHQLDAIDEWPCISIWTLGIDSSSLFSGSKLILLPNSISETNISISTAKRWHQTEERIPKEL